MKLSHVLCLCINLTGAYKPACMHWCDADVAYETVAVLAACHYCHAVLVPCLLAYMRHTCLYDLVP